MIESFAIKKFIINYFIEHSQEDIDKMVLNIHRHLLRGFLMNEVVYNMKSGEYGRISRVGGARYGVVIQSKDGGHEKDCHFSDLARRDEVSASGVKGYLLGITMETPFGRVLKENAFGSIKDSSGVMKCKVPQNQCYEGTRPLRDSQKSLDREKTQGMWPSAENAGDRGAMERQDDKANAVEVEKNGLTEDIDIDSILKLRDDQILRIPGLERPDIESTMKILGVLVGFRSFFDIERIDVKELAGVIIDPLYESDIVCKTHERLIEMLKAEIDNIGMDVFIENSKPCIALVFECVCSSKDKKQDDLESIEEPRQVLEKKQWKADLEKFIKETSSQAGIDISHIVPCIFAKDRPLSKEEIRSRLVLLELLLNMFFTTEPFREVVSEKMETSKELERRKRELQARLRKPILALDSEASLDTDKRSEVKKELIDTMEKIFQLPTNIRIGEIDGIRFLNLNRKIYAAKERDYYLMSRDALLRLCKKYNDRSKSKRNVLVSIEQYMEILQNPL
ncbi:hypothetical protein EROM_090960 [Encephalitozoon romaleae SJ-2008]|uniref:DUF5097 domain-containing protein n=1 Tax=Encephalitozoon romaleae (strain SJ-2008) TaxID=1178016 RepID=I7ATE9_ENCRO|nr:hypothetical protein EROM_090960 [Encephalitozoon romaleae SJ-2008]AFN83712.1 hypothetical protein EROM_090960 [Encephalitozoon romaleae SJ-2008]